MLAAACGRRAPLPPLRAEVRDIGITTITKTPGHFFEAVAELTVPSGYDQGDGAWGTELLYLVPPEGWPDIGLGSRPMSEQDVKDADYFYRWFDETCAPVDREHIDRVHRVQFDRTADGFVMVCQHLKGQELYDTHVVRDFHWNGYELQCHVDFADTGFDHGDPSPARIGSAIAICNTAAVIRKRTEWDLYEDQLKQCASAGNTDCFARPPRHRDSDVDVP